ncbi:hypothetical protein HDU99_006050, partial [Rhizoclosmatium hyalinum]
RKAFPIVAHGVFKSGFALIKYEDMDFETGKLVETPEQKAENDQLNEKPKNMKEWGQRLWCKLF